MIAVLFDKPEGYSDLKPFRGIAQRLQERVILRKRDGFIMVLVKRCGVKSLQESFAEQDEVGAGGVLLHCAQDDGTVVRGVFVDKPQRGKGDFHGGNYLVALMRQVGPHVWSTSTDVKPAARSASTSCATVSGVS